jgi:hypothetical protein
VTIKFTVFGDVISVVWKIIVNVSEEIFASFFIMGES